MALDEILRDKAYKADALLTTMTRESDCISMHGKGRVILGLVAGTIATLLGITVLINMSSR